MSDTITNDDLVNIRDHWCGTDALSPLMAAELLLLRQRVELVLMVCESAEYEAGEIVGQDKLESAKIESLRVRTLLGAVL